MKRLLYFLFSFVVFISTCSVAFAQAVNNDTRPVEVRKDVSGWWWIIGVAVVLALGMMLYVWIKKNPRKDA